MPVGMGEPKDDDPAQRFRVSAVCSGRGISHLGYAATPTGSSASRKRPSSRPIAAADICVAG
jgi:hypothetical protein